MKASQIHLSELISGVKQYIVPLFQRPYSWGKREWSQLWGDLVDLIDNGAPRPHFMGSIVTMPVDQSPHGISKFLLIDGQQRLTTVLVLLTVLRDLALQSEDPDVKELGEEIHETLLINPRKKPPELYRLLPTQGDREAFFALIQRGSLNESPLHQAYQFFDKRFRGLKQDISILEFKNLIVSYFQCVSIVLDDQDDPYLVFESLNAKGKSLTQADLIRNFFLMRIKEDQEEVYETLWEPMEQLLGERFTEFLRHFLMRDGVTVNVRDVYFRLKEWVGSGDALEHLRLLRRFAEYYHQLLEPQTVRNSALQQRLKRLSLLEASTAYPLLLNLFDAQQAAEPLAGQQLSEPELLECLDVLENFFLRRFICNVPTQGLNKMFPTVYRQVLAGSDESFVAGLKRLLANQLYPSDAQFLTSLVSAPLYKLSERKSRLKYLLSRIEQSFGHKEQVEMENLSLEHILPQTLTDEWMGALGEQWENLHGTWLHTLGNLTLTGYNSELSNAPFARKQAILNESPLKLNQHFSKLSQWSAEEIEARGQLLAERALALWPAFNLPQAEQQTRDEVTGKKPYELQFLGERHTVKTWKDVLTRTLESLQARNEDFLPSVARQFPNLISQDPKRFIRSRALSAGYYVETNFSARDTIHQCQKVLKHVQLDSSDWKIETTNAGIPS